ncbi:MAG: molybdopterin-guanine dinucleotide biosynthesis protein B [Thermodesulfobacteriota bacterium]
MKVVCIVGPSKSGKTLLIERLVPELNRRGLRVAAVKHTHRRNVSLDIPGKDTYRYSQAGAEIIVLASPDGFSILTEEMGNFGLEEVVSALPEELDIILVEGFKQEKFPKIEIVPDDVGPLFINDPSLLALVSSNTLPAAKVPCFKPTDIAGITELLAISFSPA